MIGCSVCVTISDGISRQHGLLCIGFKPSSLKGKATNEHPPIHLVITICEHVLWRCVVCLQCPCVVCVVRLQCPCVVCVDVLCVCNVHVMCVLCVCNVHVLCVSMCCVSAMSM